MGGIRKPISHLRFSQSCLGVLAPALFPVTYAILAYVQVARDGAGRMAQIGHENNAGTRHQSVFFAGFIDEDLQSVRWACVTVMGTGLGPDMTEGRPLLREYLHYATTVTVISNYRSTWQSHVLVLQLDI